MIPLWRQAKTLDYKKQACNTYERLDRLIKHRFYVERQTSFSLLRIASTSEESRQEVKCIQVCMIFGKTQISAQLCRKSDSKALCCEVTGNSFHLSYYIKTLLNNNWRKRPSSKANK